MAKALVALLATVAFAALSYGASAQAKDCPDGKVYNPETGKCVTPRGSN
jgi:Chitin binding Peritrophin-A domain